MNSVADLFARGCDRLGISWAPMPLATISAPKEGRHPCVYRGFCNFGCSTNAKSSTLVTYIPKAVRAGTEIRSGCMAARINLGADGKAKSVSYFRCDGDGGFVEEEQKARLIIVAGYSIETPRLLLNSACARFPHGLANSSGSSTKPTRATITPAATASSAWGRSRSSSPRSSAAARGSGAGGSAPA
jgi:choline dehydrogenase-like flavoprotein